jgi:hypothetical protein
MPPPEEHGVDAHAVLVDEVGVCGRRGERGAADRDLAVARLRAESLDLIGDAPLGEPRTALHLGERVREHDLRQRVPQ